MPRNPSPASAGETPESFLYVRISRAEKAKWVKAASQEKLGLAEWVSAVLNNESERVLGGAGRFAKPLQNRESP